MHWVCNAARSGIWATNGAVVECFLFLLLVHEELERVVGLTAENCRCRLRRWGFRQCHRGSWGVFTACFAIDAVLDDVHRYLSLEEEYLIRCVAWRRLVSCDATVADCEGAHFPSVQIISDTLLVSGASNEVLIWYVHYAQGQRITQFQLNRNISVMRYPVPAGDTTVLEDYTTPDYRDRTSLWINERITLCQEYRKSFPCQKRYLVQLYFIDDVSKTSS